MTIFALAAPSAAHLTLSQGASVTGILVTVMIFVAAFLFLFNLVLAIVFRKRRAAEILSYVAAGLI